MTNCTMKCQVLLSLKNNQNFKMSPATNLLGTLTLNKVCKIFSRHHTEIFVLFFPENKF